MEKRTIFPAFLLFLFLLIITFQGCQKQEVKTTKSDSVEIKIKGMDIEKSTSILKNTDTVTVYFQYEPLNETLKLIELGLNGENQAAGGNINFNLVRLEFDLIKKRIDWTIEKKKIDEQTVVMFQKHYQDGDPATIYSDLIDVSCTDMEVLSECIKKFFQLTITAGELNNLKPKSIKAVSNLILSKKHQEP